MKKFLLFLVSLSIGLALFAWVLITVGWANIKDSILVFTGWQGIVILFLSFLAALIGAWKWREVVKETGGEISFKEIWRVYLASFSIRFLAPATIVGAEIFQGYILKKKNSIPWSRGMASVIIDRILEWTANLAVIFLGLMFFFLTIGFPPLKLAVIFGSIFLIFIFALFFFYFKVFKKESMAKCFGKMFGQKTNIQPFEIEKEIFNFFKSSKKKMICRVFSLNFLRAGVMLLRVWFLVSFLGGKIGILSALSLLGFSYLAVMIPIPMALGTHEVMQTFAFNSLGLEAAAATAFAMIIRGSELVVALFGLVILFRLGVFLVKRMFSGKISNFVEKDNARS
ncbi:MAG: lysylphosphatidylglycerol synthase transmembrane domain-containing protein [bacterium]|nr:lysylphosphatidylglycerol synthase transmembrane domain-containing protein [bacterium]